MTINEIKHYSKNAKKHPDKQLKQIADSLREFGWQQPIVVDKNGVIIVGHGRYSAFKKFPEGIAEPRIEVANLTDEQAKAYRLADNKLNESEWDMGLAIEELRELSEDMQALTGFDLDLLIDEGDFGEDFSLKDGDKSGFQQMTFTFSDEQAEKIKECLKIVNEESENFGNKNSNGNKLFAIVAQWEQKI
jgi:hypothetical protein